MIMQWTFSVDAELPERHEPSRCATRDSPHARPLFEAASQIRDASPDLFPISREVSVFVTSERPLPEPEGYEPEDAMVEVLCDAGILADDRLVSRVHYLIDPALSGYAITVEPA